MITTKPNLKFYYEQDKKKSALQYSKLAGVSVNYVKTWLKKNHEDLKLFSNTKSKGEFVPAGSGLQGHYQADVIYFDSYKAQNGQHTAILTVLHTTSRRAYAEKLKNIQHPQMLKAMRIIMQRLKQMTTISCFCEQMEALNFKINNGKALWNRN